MNNDEKAKEIGTRFIENVVKVKALIEEYGDASNAAIEEAYQKGLEQGRKEGFDRGTQAMKIINNNREAFEELAKK